MAPLFRINSSLRLLEFWEFLGLFCFVSQGEKKSTNATAAASFDIYNQAGFTFASLDGTLDVFG